MYTKYSTNQCMSKICSMLDKNEVNIDIFYLFDRILNIYPKHPNYSLSMKFRKDFVYSTLNCLINHHFIVNVNPNKAISNLFREYILNNSESLYKYKGTKILSVFNGLTGYRKDLNVDENKTNWEKLENHYPYIPFNPRSFLHLLKITKKFNKKHFLDIGHGTGSKVILATLFGNFYTCNGIEYNEFTYKISENLVPKWTRAHFAKQDKYYSDHNNLLKGDALKFNGYHNYDFLYMYEPMGSCEQMKKLYKKVLSDCKIGTLIVNVSHFYAVLGLKEFNFIKTKSRKTENPFVLIKKSKNEFLVEYI